jgi:hypothetical protein
LIAKVTAKGERPREGGHPRAAHAYAMPPSQEEANQQVQPLQQVCRFLPVRPSLALGSDARAGPM